MSMGVVYVLLWHTALNQKKADLVHIAQSQARLIEAIARFDRQHNRVDWETPIGERGPTSLLSVRAGADTFSQIVDAHKRYKGFGETGEIMIAGIEGNQIVFLLRHGSDIFSESKSVPFDSALAEPMRRALSNLSGTMIGLDYEGQTVLAAYEPIDVLNLGIVAKVNYSEVKKPFIQAGLITSAITLLIIIIGAILFRYFVNPIARQIKTNELKFKNLVENISEWVWEIDLQGTLLYSSPQAELMLGYPAGSYSDHSLYQFIKSEDLNKVQAAFDLSIKQDQPLNAFDCTFIHFQGHQVFLEISANRVFNKKGEIIGFRGIAHDVSERVAKEYELQLYQESLELMVNERTEELEQINAEMRNFAYIVSHDLRSPLVSITGFIGELQEDMLLVGECVKSHEQTSTDTLCSPDIKEVIEERIPESLYYINSATTKMNHLIESILILSRAGRRNFSFERVDLHEVVQDTLDSLAYQIEQFNVHIEVGYLPEVMTDRLAIEQIIGNLLGNALKYLSPERDGKISIFTNESDYKTIITIKDNGRGIAENDLPHIFELFKRVGKQDVSGEGMGLTYVQTLVRRLGGKINCTSILGQGSEFSFSIINQKNKTGL